jgi:hypothetical protein
MAEAIDAQLASLREPQDAIPDVLINARILSSWSRLSYASNTLRKCLLSPALDYRKLISHI